VIPDDLMTLKELAAKFPGQSPATFRRMAREGKFPDVVTVHGTVYARREQVEQWFAGQWETVRVEREKLLFHGAKAQIVNRLAVARERKAQP
jgi:hypothetical protein